MLIFSNNKIAKLIIGYSDIASAKHISNTSTEKIKEAYAVFSYDGDIPIINYLLRIENRGYDAL